jgi:hypothetical protein
MILLVGLAMWGACSSAPKTDPNVPSWLNELPPEGELWGIGSARDDDTSLAMQIAEERARLSLSRQIETGVKAMIDSYQHASGSGNASTSVSDIENMSKQLTLVTLRGAEPNRREQTPNGTWWIRVRYPRAAIDKEASDLLDAGDDGSAAARKATALRKMEETFSRQRPADNAVTGEDAPGSESGAGAGTAGTGAPAGSKPGAGQGSASAPKRPASTVILEVGSNARFDAALAAIRGNTTDKYFTIVVTDDISITEKVLDDARYIGKNILLTSDAGYLRMVTHSGNTRYTLNLKSNCTLEIENIVLRGSRNNMGQDIYGGVTVSAGKLLLKDGGDITQGRGISIEKDGTFEMFGGFVSKNGYSGVSVEGGTFTMSGGQISGNTGNGVSVEGGTFTMSGGEISGNSGYYGGVFVNGGGVYMAGGTFIKLSTGGVIYGNDADPALRNTASNGGAAVTKINVYRYVDRKRDTTIAANEAFDSNSFDSNSWK